MTGCDDCTVAGNSLLSFNRERPVIRLGADRETSTRSRHNHLPLIKVLPNTGYEERPQVELSEGTEANLVLLPLAAGPAARRAVLDHGSDNQICALPSTLGDTDRSLPSR